MQYICSEKPNYKEFCFSRGSTENPPPAAFRFPTLRFPDSR